MKIGILVTLLIVLGSILYTEYITKPIDTILLNKSIKVPATGTRSPIVHLVDNVQHIACTAFVVSKDYAITAAHCLNLTGSLPTYPLKVFFSSGDYALNVKAAAYHTQSDIGLLEGDFHDVQSLKSNFVNDELITERNFAACGYPRGDTELVCNSFTPENNSYDKIQGRGLFFHGMSGGPIINLKTGEVVAVISSMGEGTVQVAPLQGFYGLFPALR